MSSEGQNVTRRYMCLSAVQAEINACGANTQSADALKWLEKHYSGNSRYPKPQEVEMQLIVYLLADHRLYGIITDLIKFTQKPSPTDILSQALSEDDAPLHPVDAPLHPVIATPVIGAIATLANQISTTSYGKDIDADKKLLKEMISAVKQSPPLARALEASTQLNENLEKILGAVKPKQAAQTRYSHPAI